MFKYRSPDLNAAASDFSMGKSSRPYNTGEIVLSAIKKLMRNTGWTTRTIVKFIKLEYCIDDPNISRKISRALQRGARLGILQKESGRYRLNDMSRLAQPVSARELRIPRKLRKETRPLRIRSSSPARIERSLRKNYD